MDNKNKNSRDARKDSRLVLTILFTFFAVVFAINFLYIYLAQKTWTGVWTQNSYQKGLEYNKTLEYVKHQKELGWKFAIKYANSAPNMGELQVCLFDKKSQKIVDAKLVVKIVRPTQEGLDFSQNLLPQDGCYFARINFPLKGQWVLEVQGFKGDDVLQEVKKYVVQ